MKGPGGAAYPPLREASAPGDEPDISARLRENHCGQVSRERKRENAGDERRKGST